METGSAENRSIICMNEKPAVGKVRLCISVGDDWRVVWRKLAPTDGVLKAAKEAVAHGPGNGSVL